MARQCRDRLYVVCRVQRRKARRGSLDGTRHPLIGENVIGVS